MLQTICDNYDEVLIYEAQSGFCDGFSCAVKILTEAYNNKQLYLLLSSIFKSFSAYLIASKTSELKDTPV